MTALTYADLAAAEGSDLGYSRWITIDQSRIDAFAGVTEDHQWIHVDPARAATGPFGTTIAHGYLTLSLIAGVLDEVLVIGGAGMTINYGADRVRFPSPVPTGSRVRGRAEIGHVSEVTGGYQLTVRVTMEIYGAAKPACVADILVRAYPPEADRSA